MRKRFVVPVLREEKTLARLTLQILFSGGCGLNCVDGFTGPG